MLSKLRWNLTAASTCCKSSCRISAKRRRSRSSTFDTEIEAAKARDQKALELFGEYAWRNFPDDRS
jgi:hypothetical protein